MIYRKNKIIIELEVLFQHDNQIHKIYNQDVMDRVIEIIQYEDSFGYYCKYEYDLILSIKNEKNKIIIEFDEDPTHDQLDMLVPLLNNIDSNGNFPIHFNNIDYLLTSSNIRVITIYDDFI